MKTYYLKKGNVTSEELYNIPSKKRGCAWVRVNSQDKEDITRLSHLTNIRESHFYEFFEEDERPRVFLEQDYVMVIFRSPLLKDEYIMTSPIAFFITDHYIITLEKNNSFILDNIEKNLQENGFKHLLKENPIDFLVYALDKINVEYNRYVSHVESNTEILNAKISDLSEKHTEHLYRASVTSGFFQQALIANLEVLAELRKMKIKFFQKNTKSKINDIYYNYLQTFDTHKIQKELLTHLFDMQSVVYSNRMNSTMKKFTSLAFIIMVPTLITGIYGMNFNHNMYLTNHPFGFSIMLGIMISITGILWYFFKKLELI